MLISGVHATIAGVLTAMTVPMRRKDGRSPLIAAEHTLKGWVQFAIMPIFALAYAGVVLHGVGFEAFLHPIALGAAMGLVLGKPIGITLAAYLTHRMVKQRLPGSLPQMLGIAMLAGIGFTMSLFIGNLAFGTGDLATPVRFGVLGGSLISAMLGLALLWWCCRKLAPQRPSALSREEEIAEERGVFEDIDPPQQQLPPAPPAPPPLPKP
jgi:NhaA family Na+:H+ antiporter